MKRRRRWRRRPGNAASLPVAFCEEAGRG
ncbi:hypothetical protein EE612_004151 [Oryza sativa]|nr:hypothetical protein EE612_004151 [Oryza sativa]